MSDQNFDGGAADSRRSRLGPGSPREARRLRGSAPSARYIIARAARFANTSSSHSGRISGTADSSSSV